jgi:hypothetical protein
MPLAVRHVAGALLVLGSSLFASHAVFCQNHAFTPADPVRTQLLALGKTGQTIELARERVLEILEEPNACSAWFSAANPDPAGVFASLTFAVDENGPAYITATRTDSGAFLFKHPYSGATQENAGLHALITLNANGPFFTNSAALMKQDIIGSAFHRDGWRIMEIGSYTGSTLPAQVVTLLHELGHVIGRIPEDSDVLSLQSTRNTREVVQHCRSAIKESVRHGNRLRLWLRAVTNGANY